VKTSRVTPHPSRSWTCHFGTWFNSWSGMTWTWNLWAQHKVTIDLDSDFGDSGCDTLRMTLFVWSYFPAQMLTIFSLRYHCPLSHHHTVVLLEEDLTILDQREQIVSIIFRTCSLVNYSIPFLVHNSREIFVKNAQHHIYIAQQLVLVMLSTWLLSDYTVFVTILT